MEAPTRPGATLGPTTIVSAIGPCVVVERSPDDASGVFIDAGTHERAVTIANVVRQIVELISAEALVEAMAQEAGG